MWYLATPKSPDPTAANNNNVAFFPHFVLWHFLVFPRLFHLLSAPMTKKKRKRNFHWLRSTHLTQAQIRIAWAIQIFFGKEKKTTTTYSARSYYRIRPAISRRVVEFLFFFLCVVIVIFWGLLGYTRNRRPLPWINERIMAIRKRQREKERERRRVIIDIRRRHPEKETRSTRRRRRGRKRKK